MDKPCIFEVRVLGEAVTLCSGGGYGQISAEPSQHVKVVDGKIGQHAAVRARCVERLGSGCGRDLLRVDDYGLANGAQHSLRNRFSQVYVRRCKAQRKQQVQTATSTQIVCLT